MGVSVESVTPRSVESIPGVGLRIQDSAFGVSGFGFRVCVRGLGFGVWGLGFTGGDEEESGRAREHERHLYRVGFAG